MAIRIYPISAFPATEGLVYPDTIRTTSNDFWLEGIGVVANLSSDAEAHYVFRVPIGLPSGQAKLELNAMSYAANGNAQVNPYWKSMGYNESFDLAIGSLNAEGTQTLTWTSGSTDLEMLTTKVTLDADTVVANEFIMMRLVFETSSWTLDTRSIWLPTVIWE